MPRDLSAAARLARRASVALVPLGLLEACWLTAPFDGLVEEPGDAGRSDGSSADAMREGGHVDSGRRDAGHADARRDAREATVADGSSDAGPDATGSVYRQTVLDDAPLAYWRVGEVAGTKAYDEVDANPPAIYVPAVTLGRSGALAGDPNKAVLLDGVTGCLDTHATTALRFANTDPITIEAWVNPAAALSDPAAYPHVYVQEATNGAGKKEGYGLFLHLSTMSFQRHVDGAATTLTVDVPPAGVFTHVVAVYDGSALHVYVDGALPLTEPVGGVSDTRSMPAIVDGGGGAYVGCLGNPAGFHGTLDEIAVYGHALTAAEALHHYKVGSGT